MSDSTGTPIEDPPTPDLDELQQRPALMVTVPVQQQGPLSVRLLPSKTGPVSADVLSVTPLQVLGADLGRASAVLVCDVDWLISTGRSSTRGRWPADVPLYIGHCDEIFASVSTGTGNLTTVTEFFAT